MKATGIKLTYYMKNGTELVDESFRFAEPVDENNKDFVESIETIKRSVKDAVSDTKGGYIAYGRLYVNTAEINAILFEVKYDPPTI